MFDVVCTTVYIGSWYCFSQSAYWLPTRENYFAHGSIRLLILTFSVLVANPRKLLYTVANPARGLLNRDTLCILWSALSAE